MSDGKQVVRDGFEDDLRKALGDGVSHLPFRLRIDRPESECFRSRRRRRPLRVGIPDALRAAVKAGAQSSAFRSQPLGDS